MNEYKGKGSDRQKWLSLWSGEPIIVDRKSGEESIAVDKPFACVLGSLTTEMLPELLEEKGRADGSLDRLLISYPDKTPLKEWSEIGISEQAKAKWQTIVNRLLDRTNTTIYKLSPNAKRVWAEWYNANNAEMEDPGLLPSLRGCYSKMKSHCARLALVIFLLHVASGEATGSSIDERSMRAAAKLADYFKSHAKRVHRAIVGRFGALSPDGQAVLTWIVRNNHRSFDERKLWLDLKSRLGNEKRKKDILHELIDLHLLREQATDDGKKLGRTHTKCYDVHPEVFNPSKPSKPSN